MRLSEKADYTELVKSGADYFERLLEMIRNAEHEIHFQTYIFDPDETGKMIADALIGAAKRKVKIYLIVDSYGSKSLSKTFIPEFKKHGIEFRFFAPWYAGNTFFMGRRLHHKVIVADSKVALIGGINIADKYRGAKNKTAWLDYAVLVKGDGVGSSLQYICRKIFFKNKKIRLRKNKIADTESSQIPVHIIRNDWFRRKNEISKSYIRSIKNANHEMIFVASYFLPGRRLLNTLRKASRRGVNIKIILSGISDVPLITDATRYFYAFLLRHNIELYEWKNSVLHGKAFVSDNNLVSIGSFNLNHLSSYASIEMNLEIASESLALTFKNELNDVIKKCSKIAIRDHQFKNHLLEKFRYWISYNLVRASINILTYYTYNRMFKKLNVE